jgi:hypothetical protein
MTLVCATVAAMYSNKQLSSLVTKLVKTPFHTHNIQLPSPVFPSTQPFHISPLFISTSMPQQCAHSIPSLQINLMPINSFVHEVLHRPYVSGRVLQIALFDLEAICAKVPKLLGKEMMRRGVEVKSLWNIWCS